MARLAAGLAGAGPTAPDQHTGRTPDPDDGGWFYPGSWSARAGLGILAILILFTLALLAWLTLLLNPLTTSAEEIIFLAPLLAWIEGRSDIPQAIRGAVWGMALLLPWAIFFATVTHYESHAVSARTAILFGLWVAWMVFRPAERVKAVEEIRVSG